MASSIKNAKLTVYIKEDLELNATAYGSNVKFVISDINEASQRIVTVPTFQTDILLLSSSNGAGTFASSSLKYARLTNLDNANFVRLTFTSGSNASGGTNQYEVQLDPKRSFVFTNDKYSGSASGRTFDSFASFTNLKAVAATGSVDMEIFVATT